MRHKILENGHLGTFIRQLSRHNTHAVTIADDDGADE
jgi:hypothetical protein